MSSKWYLVNIPKVMHVYFGGRMPYMRYLTIATFKKLNPDWRVKFYYPRVVNDDKTWSTQEHKISFNSFDDYFDKARELADDTIEVTDMHNVSEVHKSDFLRWELLSSEGGLWSDMDIIYFKPISDACFNTPAEARIDTLVCMGEYGHSVGFLLSSPGNYAFGRINHYALSSFNGGTYQSIGANLCNDVIPPVTPMRIRRDRHRPRPRPARHSINPILFTKNIYNIPMDVVYAYDALRIRDLFIDSNLSRFTPNSIGIHWFGGSEEACVFMRRTRGGELLGVEPVMERIIKDSYENI